MKSKVFVLLVAGVLVLGGMVGGAFAGGVALGKGQGERAARSSPSQSSSPSQPRQQQLEQFRQQLQGGQMSQEQLDQFRQQFQGSSGQGPQFMVGRGGLTGTIEKVEGNTIAVNTSQGPLQVTVGTDTIIQRLATGALSDLLPGTTVTVAGQRGEDGKVQAQSVMLVPADASGFSGGMFFPGGQRPGQ